MSEKRTNAARERLYPILSGMAHPGLARAIEAKAEQRLAAGDLAPAGVEAFVRETRAELAPMAEAFGPPEPDDVYLPKALREHRGEQTAIEEARRADEAERAPAAGTAAQREVRMTMTILAATLEADGHGEHVRRVQRAVEEKVAADPGFTLEHLPAFVGGLSCVPSFVKDRFVELTSDADEEGEPDDHPFEDDDE